jgi:hypothetical protein
MWFFLEWLNNPINVYRENVHHYNKAIQMRAKTMSRDTWLSFFEWLSIGAGLLAVAALIGTGVMGKKVNARQAEEILTLETGLADAKAKQAEAQTKLERLKTQVEPRRINREVFLKALEGQPKVPIQIVYLRDDQDSLEFAQEITNLLERAKWEVTAREPIPTPTEASRSDIPTAMSVGGNRRESQLWRISSLKKRQRQPQIALGGKDW